MILTEQEARKKWCPEARVAVEFGGTGQLVVANAAVVNPGCHASECMFWRWAEKIKYHESSLPLNSELWREVGPAPWNPNAKVYVRYTDTDYERVGYCGLAGKP